MGPFFSNKAQGTIEYLVIIGVVVVIGLVVVGLISQNLGSVGGVNISQLRARNSLGVISILDTVVDLDGAAGILVGGNSDELLTLTKIKINGVETNYNQQLVLGQKKFLALQDLSSACSCDDFGKPKVCSAIVYYTTSTGLTKNFVVDLVVDCVNEVNVPMNYLEEIAPTVTLFSPSNSREVRSVQFTYDANDNVSISRCDLIVDGLVVSTDTDGNYGLFTYAPESDAQYSWDVNCTDPSANQAGSINGPFDFNFESPPIGFATSASGTNYVYFSEVLFDENNDILVVGQASGANTVTFSPALSLTGTDFGFLAKMHRDTNEWLWANHFGDVDSIGGAVIDSSNNIYVGVTNLDYSSSLLKFDSNGNIIWTHGYADTESGDLVMGADGNIYWTGMYWEELVLDSFILPRGSGGMTTDIMIFVSKLNSDGNFIWANYANTKASHLGISLESAVDLQNNLYISSYHSGGAIFGEFTEFNSGGFVAKVDGDTNEWLWVKTMENTAPLSQLGYIDIGSDNYLYLAEEFSDTVLLDDFSLSTTQMADTFFAKMDVDGNFVWVTKLADSLATPGGIKSANDGNIYFGLGGGDAYFGSIHKDTNAFIWTKAYDGYSYGVNVDEENQPVFIGSLGEENTFAGVTIYPSTYNSFIWKADDSS